SSSRTTSASSTTSRRITCTCSSTAASSSRVAPTWRSSWRQRVTTLSSRQQWGVTPDGADRERDRRGDRLRLRDPERLLRHGGLLLQVRPRCVTRARRRDLVAQERARLDARVPAQEPRLLL